MKFIYILVWKFEMNKPTGFFDRKVLLPHEALSLNENVSQDLIWIEMPK